MAIGGGIFEFIIEDEFWREVTLAFPESEKVN